MWDFIELFESRVIASIDEYTQIVKQNSEHTAACYKNRYLVYLNSSVKMILFYEWSRQFRVMKRVEIKYFNANICHLFQIRLFMSDCHLLICYCLLNPFDRCHSIMYGSATIENTYEHKTHSRQLKRSYNRRTHLKPLTYSVFDCKLSKMDYNCS